MSDTEKIKENIDIIDFIGEYVRLKPSGSNHKGLCPFHNEKSPSFMVNRERQSFKCFGCNKGGDIFTFFQEIEGVEFVDALKTLADKAGVTLTRQANDVNKNQKNRIKDINAAAALFFHNVLMQMDVAKEARAYVKERGVEDATIEEWQIGFIPEQWDLLTRYLLKKGYGIDDLVASGMTIKRDNANPETGKGFYDRFRGRVMFPIKDVHGTVVGFTGRVLVEGEHTGGKYVNTPQTIVYDKSRVVFGLDKAKQEIRKKGYIVMVEGQMDVIACHQAGMKNVVATSGTALTEEQIKILKRYSENFYMAFDGDDAGKVAAKRGIDLALQQGMHIRVILIPEGKGKDPDECIKKNKEVWFESVEKAKEVMGWYFEIHFSGKDLENPREKQNIVDILLPEISRIPFAVERDHWMRQLAGRIGVDQSILREDLQRIQGQEKKIKTREKEEIKEEKEQITKKKSRLDLLIEQVLGLLYRFPDMAKDEKLAILDKPLSTSVYGALYENVKIQYSKGKLPNGDELQTANLKEQIDNLLMQSEWEFSSIEKDKAKERVESSAKEIYEEWKKQQRKQLEHAISKAEASGDKEKIRALLELFQAI